MPTGLPEGLAQLVALHTAAGRGKEARQCKEQATKAGMFQPWYTAAVDRAGRSDLESAWPRLHQSAPRPLQEGNALPGSEGRSGKNRSAEGREGAGRKGRRRRRRRRRRRMKKKMKRRRRKVRQREEEEEEEDDENDEKDAEEEDDDENVQRKKRRVVKRTKAEWE